MSLPLRYSQITLGKFANFSSKVSWIILLKSQSFQFLLMIDELDPASLLLKPSSNFTVGEKFNFSVFYSSSQIQLSKKLARKKKKERAWKKMLL